MADQSIGQQPDNAQGPAETQPTTQPAETQPTTQLAEKQPTTQAAETQPTQQSAAQQMEDQIRQVVTAWLRDVFENGKYQLRNRSGVQTSRDHYLEITNATNVDLRQLQMQMEIYKGELKVDQVTAKTGVSGIKAGETGQLAFLSKETAFTKLQPLLDTVTYKADWRPGQAMEGAGEKKKWSLFGRRKKKTSGDFLVETAAEPKKNQNEYVARLTQLRDQIPEGRDEEIRGGLNQLIPIVESIFARVAEVPGIEPEIRRLTDRYLPMIINSTEVYLSCVEKKVSGEEMEDLRQDVVSGLALVTEACSNLRNRLYEDGIVDASTDISVLKMLLKQDGLLNSEFDK